MASHTVAILTGASRGLGLALARALAAPGARLFALARTASTGLAGHWRKKGGDLEQILVDLSDASAAQQCADKLAAMLPRDAQRYLLINNAGTVQPIARADRLSDGASVQAALQLNVTSPMLLCSAFLRATASLDADRRILNISSGAGRNPVPGWGAYCAAKAALDHYTQVLHAENHGVRVASMAPGVIDTGMQADIRHADQADFPQLERFVKLHEEGLLSSTQDTAARILARLEHPDFGTPVLDDIRHYSFDQTSQ